MTKGTDARAVEPADADRVRDAVAVVVAREGDMMTPFLTETNGTDDMDPAAIHLAMIREVMSSVTIDDVLNLPEAEKLESFTSRRLRIFNFTWQDSEFETGPPVYFVIHGVELDSKEKVVITTGEQRVMAQLLRTRQLDAFPIEVTVQAAKRPNRHGRFPLILKALGVRSE